MVCRTSEPHIHFPLPLPLPDRQWVYWAGPVAGSLFALGLWFVLNFFGKNLRATHPV